MMTLQERIRYTFKNQQLLEQALTHKSYHNENTSKSIGHNEKLEFLGDAVLGLCLSDILIRDLPKLNEGHLSKIRASLVNESILCKISLEFEFDNLLKLGKGELLTGGANKPRLLGSAFEAFIGAFYLDAGYARVHQFLGEIYKTKIENIDLDYFFTTDYKTRLQEKSQEVYKVTPTYEVTKEDGLDHEKIFYVNVKIGKELFASGQGRNKKQAEQEAARTALEKIK